MRKNGRSYGYRADNRAVFKEDFDARAEGGCSRAPRANERPLGVSRGIGGCLPPGADTAERLLPQTSRNLAGGSKREGLADTEAGRAPARSCDGPHDPRGMQ